MIRLANTEDLGRIREIYAAARKYMVDHGNSTQWAGGWPPEEILLEDIANSNLYVLEKNGEIHGAFAFILGNDETYALIEDGEWLNDEPYGTIHRLASDGKVKGVFEKCINYAKEQVTNLRIDTHPNNETMLHLIEKNGFEKCGNIYIGDGTQRVAFHYVK